jgi:hypothetical protein
MLAVEVARLFLEVLLDLVAQVVAAMLVLLALLLVVLQELPIWALVAVLHLALEAHL